MINLSNCVTFKNHRSGWAYAINSLLPLQSNSGVYFDGFIEKSFSWELHKINSGNPNKIPYRFPWIGFMHNPYNMPFFLIIIILHNLY